MERRLAAIVSADVVGYSRLLAADEDATLDALRECRRSLAAHVAQRGGRVVDTPGDNALAELPSALSAVECCAAFQQQQRRRNLDLASERRMELRIGVHMGDVSVDGDKLYGDGVNIASRLESLSDPGGLCISAAVYDQIRSKLDLAWEDLGEQTLKNLPHPVRVYRLAGPATAESPARSADPDPFAGRPAIAVLAFENLSGDPEQEFFADGVAEDLITRLSEWRSFPVLARHSSFVYKGQAVDVKRVGHELGARYVVEGSVRKAGGRVRVTAQLIDATTGHHVWAERYDRPYRDIFELQDEITEAIVGSMHPELRQFEIQRAGRQAPSNLDAWECVHRGMWHFDKLTKEDNAKARELYERAIELDPGFATAYGSLARTHQYDVVRQWSDSPADSLAAGLRAAQRAVQLDPHGVIPHISLAFSHALAGERERALASVERAVELGPSSADAHYNHAYHLTAVGRAEEALASLDTAQRLSPRHPEDHLRQFARALAHFAAEQYAPAIAAARHALELRRDWSLANFVIAASLALLGRVEEARASLEALRREIPDLSLGPLRLLLPPGDTRERLERGLRAAGFDVARP